MENKERKLIGVVATFDDGSKEVIDCSTEENAHVVLLTFGGEEIGSYVAASTRTLVDSIKVITMNLCEMYKEGSGKETSPVEVLLSIAFGGN